jgi:hypothetical protein
LGSPMLRRPFCEASVLSDGGWTMKKRGRRVPGRSLCKWFASLCPQTKKPLFGASFYIFVGCL